MEIVSTLILLIVCGYLVYRFGLYAYKKGLSDGFEETIEYLEEIELYTCHLLEKQEPESYRFYYGKGNLDAVEQIKGTVIKFKEFGG
ncbi:Uncharacterised protein [Enterococcus saccharolyticus]|uniref:hypothetical protein n=1 Tax=Enterococcus saccharolyticus TaxID=41997 RepID=UPI001027AFBF|nr:hypothetical protein [Enterococcus saccharolyticus]VFA64271.1 Uncharacterised protein [Enterococcus saccharolyticus]